MRVDHIGESYTKDGHTLTITERDGKFSYGKAAYIGLWEDGTKSRRFVYADFKKKRIAYGSFKTTPSYIGKKEIMNCGHELTITEVIEKNRSSVKCIGIWDTGEVSKPFFYSNFKKKEVYLPPNYIGLSKEFSFGHILTITEKVEGPKDRRSSRYKGVWEDGTESRIFTINEFNCGTVAYSSGENLIASRIGLSKIMNNGKTLTIIKGKNSGKKGIIVYKGKWEDDTESDWFQYGSFTRGQISYNKKMSANDYIGQSKIMSNGLILTVTGVYPDKNSAGNSVLYGVWEDEEFCPSIDMSHYKKAQGIAHPFLNPCRCNEFHNFHTSKKLWEEGDSVYYKCKCNICGLEDILTPQQMMEHSKTHD